MAEGERQTRGGVVHSGKNSATPPGAGSGCGAGNGRERKRALRQLTPLYFHRCMVDLATLSEIPEWKLRHAEAWRNAEFVWKRFHAREDWSHDHCLFRNACICEHRERDPYDKPGPVEGGHYRHAFYSQESPRVYVWVCRSCFKRVRPLLNWTVRRRKTRPTRPLL
jgi:hypothetical protein